MPRKARTDAARRDAMYDELKRRDLPAYYDAIARTGALALAAGLSLEQAAHVEAAFVSFALEKAKAIAEAAGVRP